MKHVITFITGAEDWEMLYIDGKKVLACHQIYAQQVLEVLSELKKPFKLITFNWIGEDDTLAWEKVFSDSPDELWDIMEFLIGPEFEKYLGKEER